MVVFETRDHVAGNCHTERDPETDVMIHRYGPHIFHTGNERVWAYVNRFGTMMPYNHRVRTTVRGRVYLLPVNLLTINQLFETALGPDEARAFIAEQADSSIGEPAQLRGAGAEVHGPAAVRGVLPRLHPQAVGLAADRDPGGGAQAAAAALQLRGLLLQPPAPGDPAGRLHRHRRRRSSTTPGSRSGCRRPTPRPTGGTFDHSVWTGPLDAWFGYRFGRLGYRTLDFEEIRAAGDYLGCAVMNYGDLDVPYTRIAEHKHFAPWEEHERTVCFRETSRLAERGRHPLLPDPAGERQERARASTSTRPGPRPA